MLCLQREQLSWNLSLQLQLLCQFAFDYCLFATMQLQSNTTFEATVILLRNASVKKVYVMSISLSLVCLHFAKEFELVFWDLIVCVHVIEITKLFWSV